MKSFMAAHPDAKVALDQLQYARGWFSTYDTVAVRKAMDAAQKQADTLMKPYVDQTALKLSE